MKTNSEKSISPYNTDRVRGVSCGLTVREHFALELAKSMIQSEKTHLMNYSSYIADEAVIYADSLIKRLNEE